MPAGARTKLVAALLAVYVIWGSTYFAMSVALKGFPPFVMAGTRFLAAGALLYGGLRARGAPRPSAREWRGAALVGALLLFGGNGAVAVAERSVASGTAAVVVATMPLFAALFAAFWGAWPRGYEWTGLALGFAGVVLLHLGRGFDADAGALVVLALAPVSWALGSVVSRHVTMPPGAMSSAAQMLVAGAAMLVFGVAFGERVASPPWTAVAALAYLALFGSIVAFSAYGFLLRTTRPALATSYAYVNPVVAVALGAGFNHERVEPTTLLALVIILAGVGVLSLGRASRRASKAGASV